MKYNGGIDIGFVEITLDENATTIYVENGTKLQVTLTSGKPAVDGAEISNTTDSIVVFTVENENVTVTAE